MSQDLQAAYSSEVERLLSYLQKSYKARVKWVKKGDVLKAIDGEIGLAIAGGRMDLVENLMLRRLAFVRLQKSIESMDYEQRFGSVGTQAPLPKEIETDSTQFAPEKNTEVASKQNQ